MPFIRFTATLDLHPTPGDDPDPAVLESRAREQMDHAPDLLYDSEDTIYRFEIVHDEAPDAGNRPETAAAIIDQLEALLARLKNKV